MENYWDNLLNIKTSGRDETMADRVNYPYEPTSYKVLERLAKSGLITKQNVLLDYGCGKGRVDFYLSYETKCKTIGIDYDIRMIEAAKRNQENSYTGNRTVFLCKNASGFDVPDEVDCCYFFNPFSLVVLKGALEKLVESYQRSPRNIRLFFYYPSNAYIGFLSTEEHVNFVDEISCMDLYKIQDEREVILIYEIG